MSPRRALPGLRRLGWRSAFRLLGGRGRSAARQVRRLTTGAAVPVAAPTFDVVRLRAEALAAVRDALERAQVDHVVVPAQTGVPARVGIPAERLDDAWRALADSLAGPGWGCRGRDARRASGVFRTVTVEHLAEAVDAGAVEVAPIRSAGGLVVGADVACWVEPWRAAAAGEGRVDGGEHGPGTRLAPWSASGAAYLTSATWDRAVRSEDRWPVALPHLLDVRDPVDVVYTWVDGDDPAWRARRDAALAEHDPESVNETAAVESRYVSRDELRYSLRSLAAYAGWVRHVWLVTDGQVPPWLDTDHPGITVVDHREIFTDPDALPTFNSHAIESQLHHVPGLAERYLYLNDDVFLGRPVAPEIFFHGNGVAQFFLSANLLDLDPPSARDLPVVSAAKNNRRLVEQAFGATVTHKFFHSPHPQLRSVLLDIEERFADEVAAVQRSRFRSPDDISVASSLHHYVAYATGRAVPGRIAYRYVDLARPDAERRLARLLQRRDRDVFCLNDVASTHEQLAAQRRTLARFLEEYFPVPSPFERT